MIGPHPGGASGGGGAGGGGGDSGGGPEAGRDEALLAELRVAIELTDPVPGRVLAAARAALDRREPAALPIFLVRDSDARGTGHAGAGVRGGGPRLLSFAAGPAPTVEIEVTGTGPERLIVGRLEPPAPAWLRVRHRDGEHTTRVGAAGHFQLSGVPPGPISLIFRLPDATSIVTSWVRI